MKISFYCFSFGFLLSLASISQASEQKRIFNVEAYYYESDTSASSCKYACDKKSDEPIDSIISPQWKIISSSQKEVIAINYYKSNGGVLPLGGGYVKPFSEGCTCKGIEYVIEKIDTIQTANSDTKINKELELLKYENEILKREIIFLKKQNEDLKAKFDNKKKNKS